MTGLEEGRDTYIKYFIYVCICSPKSKNVLWLFTDLEKLQNTFAREWLLTLEIAWVSCLSFEYH